MGCFLKMIDERRPDACPTCGEIGFSGWILGHHYCDGCHQTFDDYGDILCQGRYIDNGRENNDD